MWSDSAATCLSAQFSLSDKPHSMAIAEVTPSGLLTAAMSSGLRRSRASGRRAHRPNLAVAGRALGHRCEHSNRLSLRERSFCLLQNPMILLGRFQVTVESVEPSVENMLKEAGPLAP